MNINKLIEMGMWKSLGWLIKNKKDFALVPRKLDKSMRIAYHKSIERHEDCQEDIGCPDDQWIAMINEYEEGL